ncbi:hypothetical protein Dimus_033002 [Dionaea muscipula]
MGNSSKQKLNIISKPSVPHQDASKDFTTTIHCHRQSSIWPMIDQTKPTESWLHHDRKGYQRDSHQCESVSESTTNQPLTRIINSKVVKLQLHRLPLYVPGHTRIGR